jgi:uncharacterized membrane protein YkvA (DUF1232 family)
VKALLVLLAAAASLWLLAIGMLMLLGRKLTARRLFRLLPDLLMLFRGLMTDERVPRSSKAWMWFGAAWIASPIDLIPEFVPILGPLDDAVIAALVLRHVVKRAGADVVADHWHGDAETLAAILRAAGVKRA